MERNLDKRYGLQSLQRAEKQKTLGVDVTVLQTTNPNQRLVLV